VIGVIVPERCGGVGMGDWARRAKEAARGEESLLEKEMVWKGEAGCRGRLSEDIERGVLISRNVN